MRWQRSQPFTQLHHSLSQNILPIKMLWKWLKCAFGSAWAFIRFVEIFFTSILRRIACSKTCIDDAFDHFERFPSLNEQTRKAFFSLFSSSLTCVRTTKALRRHFSAQSQHFLSPVFSWKRAHERKRFSLAKSSKLDTWITRSKGPKKCAITNFDIFVGLTRSKKHCNYWWILLFHAHTHPSPKESWNVP